MNHKKVILAIMDGWGLGNHSKSDAIFQANTPNIDRLMKDYPHSQLETSGTKVGLPEGQMGNSEVGHLNIGAGRIVYQDLEKINKEITSQQFFKNQVLLDAFKHAEEHQVSVHFIGLASDGGVHSHINHLKALCDMSKTFSLPGVFIHAFMDGRDTDPKAGYKYIQDLLEHIKNTNIQISTCIGRYFAMDRDHRWERIKKAYDLLTIKKGTPSNDLLKSIKESYEKGVTDEFLEPIVNQEAQNGVIKPNDVVICFNFRTDRCRQITEVLTQKDIPEQHMHKLPLYYVTMTNYDDEYKNVKVVFDKEHLHNTLGEVLAKHGKTQLRTSETEKYPHVTFFFSGGKETLFEGEKRILVNSPKVATYDLQPSMSADELTEKVLHDIALKEHDFICINYPNADMVGHTGVYSAIIEAVEKVDESIGRIVQLAVKNDYSLIIIADHGNADFAINDDGSPNTAHTTNPVPCILIDKDYTSIKNGILADIAPTILDLLDIEKPAEMNGNSLLS